MYNNFERDEVQQEMIIDVVENKNNMNNKKKGKRATVKLLAGALVAGMLAGVGFEGVHYVADTIQQSELAKEQEKVQEENNIVASSTSSINTEGNVSSLVENVMPAIVSIDTTITQRGNSLWQGSYSNEATGSGSGIIIGENDTELLIVTNNHVIEGENAKVKVNFHDESTAEATIKGADAASDLAVLAVNKNDLTKESRNNIKIATLGDSTKTKVGEVAVAIGNALGIGQSVTVGYISAKDRQIAMEDYSMALLQTDAAINPGNSGGALLNAAGEVIGINSVKYSSEEVEGMGYAIPISDAIPIINELMNREQLDVSEQGYLGIRGQDVTETTGGLYNMPEGIYVGEVTEGSPAQKGGIVTGDIIVKINDKKVTTLESLQDTLTYTKAGTTVNITVKELENGEYVEKTLEVTLGSKSEMGDSTTEEEQSQIEDSQNNRQNRIPIPFGR